MTGEIFGRRTFHYRTRPVIPLHLAMTEASGIKLLVTGSRSIRDARIVTYALEQTAQDLDIVLLYHGDAKGVDRLAGAWADAHGIPVQVDHAADGKYYQRDRRLVDRADRVVAIWDGRSNGTRYTMEYAKRCGKFHYCWLEGHAREELGLR